MNRFWKPSLQTRLVLVIWTLTTISTFTAALLSGYLLIQTHLESVRAQLQATATSLISLGISDFEELKDFEHLNEFIENALQMERIDKIIRIYDITGRLAYSTVGSEYDSLPTMISPVTKPKFLAVSGRQNLYESLILPYGKQKSKRTFFLQVAIRLPKYVEILESLIWPSIILFTLLSLTSLVAAHLLGRRLLRPVRGIARYLRKLDFTQKHWPALELGMSGQYLDEIVQGINILRQKTQASMEQLRKMSRYVAHEIRTPLTIIQGEAETVLSKRNQTFEDYERIVRSSLEEVSRMSDVISAVMALDGRKKSIEPVAKPYDLTRWLLQHKERWGKTFGKPLVIQVPDNAPLMSRLEPKLLIQLIDNLVRNVRDHTTKETSCHIALTRDDTLAKISVTDDGPGMPSLLIEQLNHTTDESLQPIGVGIHLCQRIAEVLKLRLEFTNRPKGGLEVSIIIPL
ncbi:MAG: HAMP domain-containing histidine kinase [Deltaproteobacteria bacterium]|nr:HAMP domain-containing histidine kinase [Deltaproteobacteria bacterium]